MEKYSGWFKQQMETGMPILQMWKKQNLLTATVSLGGKGLDFGMFCDRDTTSFGIDLSDTDGFFVPRSDCTGDANF